MLISKKIYLIGNYYVPICRMKIVDFRLHWYRFLDFTVSFTDDEKVPEILFSLTELCDSK